MNDGRGGAVSITSPSHFITCLINFNYVGTMQLSVVVNDGRGGVVVKELELSVVG